VREHVQAVLRANVGDGQARRKKYRSNSHVLVKEWKSEASFLARALAGASSSRRQDGDPWNRSLFGGQDLRASVRLHTAREHPADKARSLRSLVLLLRSLCVSVSCVVLLVVASWTGTWTAHGRRKESAVQQRPSLVHVNHASRFGRH
jgi:hypothetical protein